MDRTADGKVLSGAAFEGCNIDVVSLKAVRIYEDGAIEANIRRHGGAPASMIWLTLDHGSESPDVESEGHKRVSLNGYTEAPMTIGPYVTVLASRAFDRHVNIGAFDWAPANATSAVIHAISLRTDTPQAIIESGGDCITSGQLQPLKTVAVQCHRRRDGLYEKLSA